MNNTIMETPTLPLALTARQVMKLLSVKENTLAKWIAEGKLHVLPLFNRNRMFASSEVLKLAEIPVKK